MSKSSTMPNTKVAAAAHRNHHSARDASLSVASLRAAASIAAKAGTWTKLKYHSNPIHMMPTTTCAHRKRNSRPKCLKSQIVPSIATPPLSETAIGVRIGGNVALASGAALDLAGSDHRPSAHPCLRLTAETHDADAAGSELQLRIGAVVGSEADHPVGAGRMADGDVDGNVVRDDHRVGFARPQHAEEVLAPAAHPVVEIGIGHCPRRRPCRTNSRRGPGLTVGR